MNNKNPILVFTGLAIAAVAGVAGLTRDRWMAPQTAPAPAETQQQAVAPSAEPPAAPAAAPAPAGTEQQAVAPAAEPPAAPAAAPAPAGTEQQAATPAAEPPAAPAAAPAPAGTEQQAAAPAAEPVAAPAEAPAKAEVQQQATAPAAQPPDQPAAPAQAEVQQPATGPTVVPTFDTVRIEKTGEAVIAGRAEAGSEVVVKLDGATIGKTTANEQGAFVVVPDQPLPAGSGAMTIESKTDKQPAATASEQTVAVIVPEQARQDALVAVISPNEPTKVLQKPEPAATPEPEAAPAAPAPAETAAAGQPAAPPEAAAPVAPRQVSLDAVDYDAAGNIVFSGRGEPGTSARIYVDNRITGEADIDGGGRWSFAGTTDVQAGVHALRVDGIGKDGNVINRIEVPFFREEHRKVAAVEPPPAEAAPAPAPVEQPAVKAGTEAAPAAGQPAAPEAQTPAAATDPAAQPAKPKDGRVVIQPGNNLWRISKVIYGSGVKYTVLYEANKDQIRDPDMIYPGQIFKTPDVVPPETIDPKRRDPLVPEDAAASGQ